MSYDPLMCFICCEQYDSRNTVPHLATCGHSVCSQCSGKLQNNGDIIRACPVCLEGSFHNSKQNMLAIEILVLIDKAKDEQYARTKGIDNYFENNGAYGSNLQNRSFEHSSVQLRVQSASGSVSERPRVAQFQSPLDKMNVKAIFVKNIPRDWTLWQVNSYFTSFGTIENSNFGNRANINRGLATIFYKEASSAFQAIQKMNGFILDGNQINVVFHSEQKRNQTNQSAGNASNITFQAIQNLTEKRKNTFGIRITGIGRVTEGELEQFFSRFGTIKNTTIKKNNKNQPIGVNLIYFESADAARYACTQCNGATIPGVEGKMTIYQL